MRGGRAHLPVFSLCALLAALPAASSAYVGGHHLSAALSRDQLTATIVGDTVEVRAANGHRTAVPIELGTRLQGLAEMQGGWLLAMTVQSRDRQRVQLRLHLDGGDLTLPELPGTAARIQERPTLLVQDGQLEGIAWLEGPTFRSLRVRVADWDGMRWVAPETVALPVHGSQMALSGAVLTDGTPLIVWSRYDGHDDEIVWSRRIAGRWTAPARIEPDNAQPDVTPTLLAVADGNALVAWSSLVNGDYRVLTSRFDGHHWSAAQTLPGLGAGDPQLLDRQGPVLLYHTVQPGQWVVARLDPADGRATAFARQPRTFRREPTLEFTAGKIAFAWQDVGVRVAVPWDASP